MNRARLDSPELAPPRLAIDVFVVLDALYECPAIPAARRVLPGPGRGDFQTDASVLALRRCILRWTSYNSDKVGFCRTSVFDADSAGKPMYEAAWLLVHLV